MKEARTKADTSDQRVLELDRDARQSLRRSARRPGIGEHDLLLVGDVTGSGGTSPMGWACTAYDRLGKRAVIHS